MDLLLSIQILTMSFLPPGTLSCPRFFCSTSAFLLIHPYLFSYCVVCCSLPDPAVFMVHLVLLRCPGQHTLSRAWVHSAASGHSPLHRPALSSTGFIQPLSSKANAAFHSTGGVCSSVQTGSSKEWKSIPWETLALKQKDTSSSLSFFPSFLQ